ncbi:cytosine permease [Enteractinococcus coprophilus]
MVDITPKAVYGSSLSSAEPYGTEEIPASERHGNARQQFTLWFAANMVLAVLVSGFFSASFGLTVLQGLSAVAVGSALGAVLMGLLAGIGAKFGVAQQVQGRGPMGYHANAVPVTLLTVVSALGWTAVNTVFAVLALQTLVDVPFWLGAVVIYSLQAVTAVWGYNLVHLINKIATVVLAVLFAVISVISVNNVELNLSSVPAGDFGDGSFASWAVFAGFFFAYVLTWTPFASDFSRYLPASVSHTKITMFTAAGSFFSMAWLGSIGVLVSSFAADLGAVEALSELTGSWAPVAMITVVLSTIPVSAMNLYGGALSLLTIGLPISRPVGVITMSVLSIGIALWMQGDPYGTFYDFLSVLAYLVMPFSTVLLLDYYLRSSRSGQAGVAELFDRSRKIEWGFIAWAIGCGASMLFWNTELFTGPLANISSAAGDIAFFIGGIASAISYLIFRSFKPLAAGTASPQKTHLPG